MRTFFSDDQVTIFHGDSLEVLSSLQSDSVDSVVTDPPYGLTDLPAAKVAAALTAWLGGDRNFIPGGKGFMNTQWDRFVPPPALWEECFRVLKPGGYLLSFAGARTQDLMGLSIRLAGFHIKDSVHWIRGDVFPKTKQSLKSGYEPIVMAQKPLRGTVAANLAAFGTGGLNIDLCRTAFTSGADEAESKNKNQHAKYGTLHGGNKVYGDFSAGGTRDNYNPPGRWPTNLLLDNESARLLDSASQPTRSTKGKRRVGQPGVGWGMTSTGSEYDDSGGPSRFFPRFAYAGRAPAQERPVVDGVAHPTVKPLAIMEWLVRLVTPQGGLVLDPFLGSGTTAEAAIRQGLRCIGSDREATFLPLAVARVGRAHDVREDAGTPPRT